MDKNLFKMDKLTIGTIPIIDTHIHTTNVANISYEWSSACPELFKDWTIEQYHGDTNKLNICKGIFVEVAASTFEKETKWIQSISSNEKSIIKGIVAHVPLNRPFDFVDEYLNDILSEKIVGVRQLFQSETNLLNPFYLEKSYIESLQLLAKKNLVFEICIYADHLPSVTNLVGQTPDNRYVLDHIGKPFTQVNENTDNKWFDHMLRLSLNPNIFCKLSAGFMVKSKTLLDAKPYINHCIKLFGVDRLIVGSDWFFSRSLVEPKEWFEFLLEVFEENQFDNQTIRKIFYDNAIKIYSLKIDSPK